MLGRKRRRRGSFIGCCGLSNVSQRDFGRRQIKTMRDNRRAPNDFNRRAAAKFLAQLTNRRLGVAVPISLSLLRVRRKVFLA